MGDDLHPGFAQGGVAPRVVEVPVGVDQRDRPVGLALPDDRQQGVTCPGMNESTISVPSGPPRAVIFPPGPVIRVIPGASGSALTGIVAIIGPITFINSGSVNSSGGFCQAPDPDRVQVAATVAAPAIATNASRRFIIGFGRLGRESEGQDHPAPLRPNHPTASGRRSTLILEA